MKFARSFCTDSPGAALNPAVALPIDALGKDGMKMHSLGCAATFFVF